MQGTGAASLKLENGGSVIPSSAPPPQQQQQQQQQQQPPPENGLSNVSIFIHQTLFAGNLECLSATAIHDHPRRYFAVLVAQSDKIMGLFLFDAVETTQCGGVSFKLEQAIDAIAVDSSTDNFVTFGNDGKSFSLQSTDDSGETQTYKFDCCNSSALEAWRRHLLPNKLPTAMQGTTDDMARSSEALRAITQKLSSVEVAYNVLKAQNQTLQEKTDLVVQEMQTKDLELKYLDDRCGELLAQFEDAEHCNVELAAELQHMNAHSLHLQSALEEAEASSSHLLDDLRAQALNHQLQIQAMQQEAERGVAALQRTFTETIDHKVALLTAEMDSLRAQLSSKSQNLELALAAENRRRTEHDAAVAAVADINRQLIEEKRQTQHVMRQQRQLQDTNVLLEAQMRELQDLNARLKTQLAEQSRESDEHEQIILQQLENERAATAELERSVANEIRCVQAAAQKNYEEQQQSLSQAWQMVHAERAQVDEREAELQLQGREHEFKVNSEKERIQKLLEKEKSALAIQWTKLKEQQGDSRQQQLLLENQLAGLEASQEKLNALEHQRNMFLEEKLRDLENARVLMDEEKAELEDQRNALRGDRALVEQLFQKLESERHEFERSLALERGHQAFQSSIASAATGRSPRSSSIRAFSSHSDVSSPLPLADTPSSHRYSSNSGRSFGADVSASPINATGDQSRAMFNATGDQSRAMINATGDQSRAIGQRRRANEVSDAKHSPSFSVDNMRVLTDDTRRSFDALRVRAFDSDAQQRGPVRSGRLGFDAAEPALKSKSRLSTADFINAGLNPETASRARTLLALFMSTEDEPYLQVDKIFRHFVSLGYSHSQVSEMIGAVAGSKGSITPREFVAAFDAVFLCGRRAAIRGTPSPDTAR